MTGNNPDHGIPVQGTEHHLLSPEEVDRVSKGHWSQPVGFGRAPALLIIDAQYYMTGLSRDDQDAYPLSCGAAAWDALPQIKMLLNEARRRGHRVAFTRFVIDPADDEFHRYPKKINLDRSENLCFKGTHGAEIVPQLAPLCAEPVFDKNRPSAFFRTDLDAFLDERGVDTLVLVGGATCNCVRATAYDSAARGYRTIVVSDGVFDRVQISHHVSLIDIDRFLGDVVAARDVCAAW